MKERIGRVGARGTGNKPPKFAVRARFALVMIALVILCVSAVAQEMIAEDWYKKGQELERKGSYEEAVKAYDKAIELNPKDIMVWLSKGIILSGLEQHNESIEAYETAIEIDP